MEPSCPSTLIFNHLNSNQPIFSPILPSNHYLHTISQHLDFIYCFFGKIFVTGHRHHFTAHQVFVFTSGGQLCQQGTYSLIIIKSTQEQCGREIPQQVGKVVKQIEMLVENPKFQIFVVCLEKYQVAKLDSQFTIKAGPYSYTSTQDFSRFMFPPQSLPRTRGIKRSPPPMPQPAIIVQSAIQYILLNKNINDYINRYGRYKPFLIQNIFQAKQSCLAYNLQFLFRTVDFTIYRIIKNTQYNFLQTDEWSIFVDGPGFIYHRRHTTIKGDGKILIIYWIFAQRIIEDYLTLEQLFEIEKVIKWYEDMIKVAEVRVVRIKDELEEGMMGSQGRVRYQTEEFELPKKKVVEMMKEIKWKEKMEKEKDREKERMKEYERSKSRRRQEWRRREEEGEEKECIIIDDD